MGGFLSSLFDPNAGRAAAETADDTTESRVTAFHSADRWQLHFNSIKETDELLVVDFAASWCGPCKFIEPAIKDMSNRFPSVHFAKIDVDELPDVSRRFEVQAMPTFVLLKKGAVIDKVVGAKKDELERKIVKYSSS